MIGGLVRERRLGFGKRKFRMKLCYGPADARMRVQFQLLWRRGILEPRSWTLGPCSFGCSVYRPFPRDRSQSCLWAVTVPPVLPPVRPGVSGSASW